MGLETLAIIGMGLQVAGTLQQLESAEDQAQQVKREGELKSKEAAKMTAAKAARQKTSFLSSGFTMEGTPSDVLASTFETGRQDVSQIVGNYQTKVGSIMSSARSSALSSLGGMAMSAGMAGMDFGSMGTQAASYMPDSALFTMNDMGMGNMAYEAMEMKDIRGGVY